MQSKLYYNQIGLRPNADKEREENMNKTLKEQFLNREKVKQGTMIDVTYVTYDNLTIVNRYVLINETFWSITNNYDVDSSITYTDIEDDLEVFTTENKKANITNILEPVDYKCLFYNPMIVDLTQKEIEKILGYKINIVKE